MRLSKTKSLLHPLRYVPIAFVGIYRYLVSPLIPPSCRFYPSCSAYAHLAFKKYGIVKGGILSLMRIGKCHPFHPGGFDPLE